MHAMPTPAAIQSRRAAFRALHTSGCFLIPNPWDVGSARYLANLGFKALATTSSGAAWAGGLPDGGMPLAQVTEGREEKLPAFRATLQPLRQALKGRDFLGGDAPDYADCIVFGSFMWARSVSPLRLLAEDDALHAWRERMLDLNGGAARRAPCFGG